MQHLVGRQSFSGPPVIGGVQQFISAAANVRGLVIRSVSYWKAATTYNGVLIGIILPASGRVILSGSNFNGQFQMPVYVPAGQAVAYEAYNATGAGTTLTITWDPL